MDKATRAIIRSIVERIENLESEKRGRQDDLKEIYAEAKEIGLNTKVLRKVVATRRQNAENRKADEELLELYMHAVDPQMDLFDPEADHAVTISAEGMEPIQTTIGGIKRANARLAAA